MTGWISNPVIGAASHRSGSSSIEAPSDWKIRLTFAFWSAKPNWIPRNPNDMFQTCQNSSVGFSRIASPSGPSLRPVPRAAQRDAIVFSRPDAANRKESDVMHQFQGRTRPAPYPTPAADTEWWRGAVIYQVYPRSFTDTDNDGIGDLPGVIAKLDYIASLGVDAIWLSPFFKSPMKDFGYDVSAYRQVDPMFGTLDDFDRLVEAAHAKGLRVIIDQVLNHTSDQHPWFQESRQGRDNSRADWYVWVDPKPDGTPPNNWLSIFC